MTVDALLSRLDGVKQRGAGRWMAKCPAHDDHGPSLSIRELDDGRILLHDFGQGCTAEAIVAAIGLTLEDLFPPREIHHGKPERRPFPAADVLRAVAFEASVVLVAATTMLSGTSLSAVDRDRLTLACSRLQAALDAAGLSS